MSKKVTMWHATDKAGYEYICKTGYLIYPRSNNSHPNAEPCVYLASKKEYTHRYGDYILKVRFNPIKYKNHTNYSKDCWQCRVYKGIKMKHVKLYEIIDSNNHE